MKNKCKWTASLPLPVLLRHLGRLVKPSVPPAGATPMYYRDELQLHRGPSGSTCFQGKLAPHSLLRGRVQDALLKWLQGDPALPRSLAEIEQRWHYNRASKGAKNIKRNHEKRRQVMGHTLIEGPCPGRCNGLDASAPMPGRMMAFVKAFRRKNLAAFDDLHASLALRWRAVLTKS